MPQSANIANSYDVLPSLALSVAEDTYAIAAPSNDPGMRPGGLMGAGVEMQSDAAWQYSHAPGGPYFTAGPYQIIRIMGVGQGKTLYVKAVAGTPTLSVRVIPPR